MQNVPEKIVLQSAGNGKVRAQMYSGGVSSVTADVMVTSLGKISAVTCTLN